MDGAPLQIWTLVMSFFSSTSWRSTTRPSVHKRNKYGEFESPCRSLLDGCKRPLGKPLIMIDRDKVDWTQFLIKFTRLSWKTILHITVSKKFHTTIISFAHIELYCHAPYLALSFGVQVMHDFMCNQHIISDQAAHNKCTL